MKKKSGLADSPFFALSSTPLTAPSPKDVGSLIKTPAAKKPKPTFNKYPEIVVVRRPDDTVSSSNRPATIPSNGNHKTSPKGKKQEDNKPRSLSNEANSSPQPDIPKHFPALVTPFLEGKNDTPFSHHIPEELKKKFGKLPHYLEDELGYKPTIAQILIVALAYTFWDYEKKGDKSMIFEALKTLKK